MTEKKDIFISYSSIDNDKVSLIVKELIGNVKFNPIIIALDPEAGRPLADKVAEGINKSQAIIPIITKKSYLTQWINQEIGYATAINKKIIPIVEKDVRSELKGFIHKHVDLPYCYNSNQLKSNENKDFIKCFRQILKKLEEEFIIEDTKIDVPKKSKLDLTLEKVEAEKRVEEFRVKRQKYLSSREALDAANKNVLDMFLEINEKIKPFFNQGFRFGSESKVYNPMFILKSEGFSFYISFQLQYSDSLEGSILDVRKFKGHLSSDDLTLKFSRGKVEQISHEKFTFNLDNKNEIGWLDSLGSKTIKSHELVENLINWLINQILKERQNNSK